MTRQPRLYRFNFTGFDGSPCVVYKRWRFSILQALARFNYLYRFHTMKGLVVTDVQNES